MSVCVCVCVCVCVSMTAYEKTFAGDQMETAGEAELHKPLNTDIDDKNFMVETSVFVCT